ncbi:hypothetical protein AURDEDRAFT_139305 [Auricularia subglabra TFB-10046 SS5]|nr:hypothetical protein AURDEDRAFT_139305 [Auricularia subglabra TFB-10046 SS5]
MSPKKYLAMVNMPSEMIWTQKAAGVQLNLSFMIAGQGLPPSPNSWAAIPIAPSPPLPDSHRPPVVPSAPLPWANCYLHTLERLSARVSRVYQHRTPGPFFTEDDHDEIRYLAGIDRRADTTARNAAKPNPHPPPPEQQMNDDDLMAAQSKVDASDPVASMLEMFPHLHADGRPEMKDHVQIWVDITVIDQPASPEELEAEMQRLKEIEWHWAERTIAAMLSNQPQTTAWLAGASGAEPPQIDEEISSPAVDDDESIVPEDAIEHRAERVEVPTHSPSADAVNSRPNRTGLATFRWILAGVGAWISRCRSFFWSLLWRKPFAK